MLSKIPIQIAFHLSVKKWLVLHRDWLKNWRHVFIQSEVKPKPIATHSRSFSRALRQRPVISSSFDWFTGLFTGPFVIGQSDNFDFGFTTFKWKTRQYQGDHIADDKDKLKRISCIFGDVLNNLLHSSFHKSHPVTGQEGGGNLIEQSRDRKQPWACLRRSDVFLVAGSDVHLVRK